MIGVFPFLILWQSLVSLAEATGRELGTIGRAVIDGLGGIDQFDLEVKKAVAHASALRDNIPAECVGLHEGGGGVVAKICFADGVCWADKMYANSMAYKNVYYANKAMAYARQYCPAIPIPEPKAWYRNKIHHYVTGWVEGNQRWDRALSLN